jgi:SagB-type dehydrogenase family enzyme
MQPGAARAASGSIELPAPALDGALSLERALATRRSVRRYSREPLALAEAGQLLWACQGVTHREGRRTAPSAGGVHALNAYLAAERVADLAPGLYIYAAHGHSLRRVLRRGVLPQLAAAAWSQDWIAGAAAALALCAVYGRAVGRYGERGRRYAAMEAGHAAQNALLEATALGLASVVVGAFDDAVAARVLDLDPSESPLCLLPVGRRF